MSEFVKHDSEKPKFHLIDPFAHEDQAKCLTFGARKYSEGNWKAGDIRTYISALERHLNEIKKSLATNDDTYLIDSDSGLQHGANLLCNAMFIHYFIRGRIIDEASK